MICIDMNSFDKALHILQEHALIFNEPKYKGLDQVPIESYQNLLDVSINMIRDLQQIHHETLSELEIKNKSLDSLLDKMNIQK